MELYKLTFAKKNHVYLFIINKIINKLNNIFIIYYKYSINYKYIVK